MPLNQVTKLSSEGSWFRETALLFVDLLSLYSNSQGDDGTSASHRHPEQGTTWEHVCFFSLFLKTPTIGTIGISNLEMATSVSTDYVQ